MTAEEAVPDDQPPPELDRPALGEALHPPLQVANALVVVLPAVVFAWLVERLPARVPAHFDAAGEVDRWGSPHEQWFFLGILLFDYALMWVVAWTVSAERWTLPEHDALRYARLQRRRRALVVRMTEWLMLCINGGFATLWMVIAFGSRDAGASFVVPATTTTAVLMTAAGAVTIAVYVVRIAKVQRRIRAIAGSNVLGTREDGWVAGGLFYYAPDDPAVFVPKRVGIGQTVNLARPAAWAFLAAVVLLVVILTVVMAWTSA